MHRVAGEGQGLVDSVKEFAPHLKNGKLGSFLVS